MIMKKQIINWGMMLAVAFTLTNCTTEFENPSQEQETVGYPFEITLSDTEARTVNSGLTTKWSDGDQINLFHAIGETTDYKNNNAFTLKSVDEGKFEGNLVEALEPEEEYDWFAFYPYKSFISTPAAQTAGWTYIGGRSDASQAQSGVNNMNHIAGDNYPLCGKAVAVPGSSQPEIEMSHAFALLQVNVTNGLEEELDVTSVSFAAATSLVGTFYPCITGDVVTYTDASYVANEAKLTVSDAKIATGETASFYLAVKPFVAAKDSDLTITVNEDCVKTLSMAKDVTFSAGKIKPLNFTYDKVAEPEPENVTWDLSTADYASATDTEVNWTSDYVDMTLVKGESQTKANNYLGGTGSYTHTRVYAGQILTFDPQPSVMIQKIEFTVVSGYMDEFEAATWTNGTSESNGNTMTVTPDEISEAVSVKISSATRFTSVKVYYVIDEDYVPPTLESIAVSGDYKIEFTQGATFSFGGVVTATYDNGSTKTVTADCDFSGYDMEQIGEQTITVTYKDKTDTYNITVVEKQQSDDTKYFVKVTAAPTDWTGTYLIVFNDNKAHSYVDSKDLKSVSGTTLTVSDNKIEYNETTEKDIVVVSVKGSGYKIKLSNDKYLTVPASNACGADKEANAAELTIEYTTSGVKISGTDSSGATRYLCANGTYYRMYKSVGSYKLPTLYKLED